MLMVTFCVNFVKTSFLLQSYFDWKLWWSKFPQWCNEETRRCALHNNNLYFFLLVYVRVESEDEARSEVVRQKCWGMNTEYPNCHTGHGSTPFYNLETFLMQLCHCHIHHSACNDAPWEILVTPRHHSSTNSQIFGCIFVPDSLNFGQASIFECVVELFLSMVKLPRVDCMTLCDSYLAGGGLSFW